MRRFWLNRIEDQSGVSGIAHVAEGVEFSDGTVVLRWRSKYRSICVYDSVSDLIAVHGHNGRTVVEWVDTVDEADGAGQ